MPTIQIIIKGKVQGVFFRATAKDIAIKKGLTGWVRNNNNGAVEIRVQGPQDILDSYISWCKIGPSKSKVINVEVKEIAEEKFQTFRIENSVSDEKWE